MNATMMNGAEDRNQRAHSAPPAPNGMTQKSFVSQLNFEPKPTQLPPKPQPEQKQGGSKVIPIIHQAGSNSSKNSTPKPTAPSNPPQNQQHEQQRERQSSGNTFGNVRHIPIFVEGRDKPVISQQQQQQSNAQKMSRPPADDENRKCSSPNQTPPMKKPTLPVSPLEIIKQIHGEVTELEKLVEIASGGARDRVYAELEEILTRKLLMLDNIETEGREDIRQTRKECIKYILSCLAKLEAKYPPANSTPAAENPCMEVVLASENPPAKTEDEVSAVEQPLAQMAVDLPPNENNSNNSTANGNNNQNAIQPTAIPLPMPPPEETEPKKSGSKTQVVKMEVTLASPSTNNQSGAPSAN